MDLVRDDYQYAHIDAAASTQVYTGNCRLIRVVVNTQAAGTTTIIDGVGDGDTVVGVLTDTLAEGSYHYGIKLNAGIRIITTAASDITVIFTSN